MIDIPLGKALIPVEFPSCQTCEFECDARGCKNDTYDVLACEADNRKDGKTVIFRLVDYPAGADKK